MFSSVKNLQKVRNDIGDTQASLDVLLEKNLDENLLDIRKQLGLISNNILRYIFEDLEHSSSQDDLISKIDVILDTSKEDVPYFKDLKKYIELLSSGQLPGDQINDDYQENLKKIAKELLVKVN